MKFKSFLYTLMAMATIFIVSCQPEEISMGKTSYTSANLVRDIAYSVDVDGNTVYLKSLLGSQYQPLWEHPQGRSQEADVTLKIPFAGDYAVVFGIMTSAGPVYADTTWFTIENPDFNLVEDPKWTYISGGVDNSKKWVLDIDANGNSKYFYGPTYFYGLDDDWNSVTNGGSAAGDDSWSWEAGWDGVAGWQFDAEPLDDYGYMEFDLIGNSNVHVVMKGLGYDYDATGTYMLNIEDENYDYTITLNDVELLHDATNEGQMDSFTGELRLLSLTEHTMQIGVVRTSDPCIVSFNYISEDAYNDPSLLVESSLLEASAPVAPSYDNLEELLFTIVGSSATYTTTEATFNLDEDSPYDWYWWDGASDQWTSNNLTEYGKMWAPEFTGDLALTIYENTDQDNHPGQKYLCLIDTDTGISTVGFNVEGNKLVFESEVKLLYVKGTNRTINIRSTEFTVIVCDPENEKLVLGIPDGTNANGATNKYLCVNMTIKGVGESGPTVISVDNDNLIVSSENLAYRVVFFNNYASFDKPWPINTSKLKLKKGEQFVIKFKLITTDENGDDVYWQWYEGAEPRASVCHNMTLASDAYNGGGGTWEQACFATDYPYNVVVDKYGETTITVKNQTEDAVSFTSDCLQLTIQISDGTAAGMLCEPSSVFEDIENEDGSISSNDSPVAYDALRDNIIEITSFTIENF